MIFDLLLECQNVFIEQGRFRSLYVKQRHERCFTLFGAFKDFREVYIFHYVCVDVIQIWWNDDIFARKLEH